MANASTLTREVVFWVTREYGVCRWNDATGEFPGNTNSGVCAYQKDIGRIFPCAAGDQVCWTWLDVCLGSDVNGTMAPGDGQRLCTNPYVTNTLYRAWCCPQETLCPTSHNSQNICLGAWKNPVAGLDPVGASTFAASILGTTTMGASPIHTNAPGFSTTMASLIDQSTTSTSSSTVSSPTTGASNTASVTIGTLKPESSGTANPGGKAPAKSLSGGAIAGIIIGIIVVIMSISVAFFWWRRQKRIRGKGDMSAAGHLQIPLSYDDKIPHRSSSYQPTEILSHNRPAELTSHTRPAEMTAYPKGSNSELP